MFCAPPKRQYSRRRCAQSGATPLSVLSGMAASFSFLATALNSPTTTYGLPLWLMTSPKRAAAACATLGCGASTTNRLAWRSVFSSVSGASSSADTVCMATPACNAAACSLARRAGDTIYVVSNTMFGVADCPSAVMQLHNPSSPNSTNLKTLMAWRC